MVIIVLNEHGYQCSNSERGGLILHSNDVVGIDIDLTILAPVINK